MSIYLLTAEGLIGVVPWAPVWMLLVITTAMYFMYALATLLISELLLSVAPGCFMYRSRMWLDRWRKQFYKEWRKEHVGEKMTVGQALVAALAFGISIMGIYNDYPYVVIVGTLGFGGAFSALRYTQRKAQRQELETEIARRFDPPKLLSEHRKSLWRRVLRVCVIVPIYLLFAAGVWPFYTFESNGILTHRWGEDTLTPWAAVSAVTLQIKSPEHSSKGNEAPQPDLQVTVRSSQGDIELNEVGALSGYDTLSLNALFTEFRLQNVPITCDLRADGLILLEKYLNVNINAPYSQNLKFIVKFCEQT